MYNIQNKVIPGVLASLCATILIAIVGFHTGLFWDNILFVNKMSTSLLEHGPFAWGSIPTISDPGHPPFIATFVTIIWKVFSRSLAVTHIALYPFIFLFCYEIWQSLSILFKKQEYVLMTFLIILADPSVFCQLMYIGTEVFILCFSSIVIRGILSQSTPRKTIGLMFLGITSMRGMLLCLGFFLWDISRHIWVEKNSLRSFFKIQHIRAYIIGSIPAVTFVVWRLINIGWIIGNPLHPWGEAWGFEGTKEFLANFAWNGLVLVQRITDFGRLIPILSIGILAWQQRKELVKRKNITDNFLFCMLVCSPVACTSLLIRNPMGHSYYLLLYIGIELLLMSLLQQSRWKKSIYFTVILFLLSGNLIVYPERISQGWNCSLASLPYWELRTNMLSELSQQGINPSKTFVYFPFGSCADDVDLSGDTRPYSSSIEEADYVLTSNICNLDDEALDRVQNYTLLHRIEKRHVYINLYKINP